MQRTASLPAVDAGPGRCRYRTPSPTRAHDLRRPAAPFVVGERRDASSADMRPAQRAHTCPVPAYAPVTHRGVGHQRKVGEARTSPGGREILESSIRKLRPGADPGTRRDRAWDSSAGRNTECRVERKGAGQVERCDGDGDEERLETMGRLDWAGTRWGSLAGQSPTAATVIDRLGWWSVQQVGSRCRNVSCEDPLLWARCQDKVASA